MATKNDVARTDCVFNLMSKPCAPMQHFSYGNKISLNEIPKANNTDIYSIMKKFRKSHYSANRMCLAVISNHSLDELEEMVRTSCAPIYFNKASEPIRFDCEDPFDTPKFKGILKCYPIKDCEVLYVTWPLPPQRQYIDSFPARILSNFLAQEGRGSLGAYLRKKGMMQEIVSGSDIGNDGDGSSFYHLLNVQINLTEKGFRDIDHVVEATCCYMRMLVEAFSSENGDSDLAKDANRYLDELKRIRDIETNYSMVMEAEDTVVHLAQMLHFLPREKSHLVYRAYQTFSNMDKNLYHELLKKYIHPRNMNLTIRSKKFKPNPQDGWVKDSWFAVDHKFESFTESQLNQWNSNSLMQYFAIPRCNDYIPACFDLLPESQDNELPTNLNEATDRKEMKLFGELWHCQKTKYKDPRAYIEVRFSNPYGRESAKNWVLSHLWNHAIDQYLKDQLYEASEIASCSPSTTGWIMSFKLSTFRDKLELLYRRVVEAFLMEPVIVSENEEKNVSKVLQLNDAKFAEYLSFIRQENYNQSLKPSKLLLELSLNITRGFFESQEKRQAMDNLTLKDLLDFRKKFLASTFIQFLVVGNFDKDQSISCFDYAVDLLKTAQPIGHFMLRPIHMPKPAFNRLRIRNLDASSRNTYSKLEVFINSKVLFQLNEKWNEQRKLGNSSALALSVSPLFYVDTMNLLLKSLLSEPCFNYLRTIKSLGYSVYTMDFSVFQKPIQESSTRCLMGMRVMSSSQTNHHELNYVSGLVLAFWSRAMPCVINCISNEDFEVAVEGLIEELRVPKVSLHDLFTEYRGSLTSGEMLFNGHELAANILEKISRCEFTEFVKKTYLDTDQPPTLLLLECDGLKSDEEANVGQEDNSSVPINYKFVTLTEKDNDEMLAVENDADIEKSHECVNQVEAKKRLSRGLVLMPSKTLRPKIWNNHSELKMAFAESSD